LARYQLELLDISGLAFRTIIEFRAQKLYLNYFKKNHYYCVLVPFNKKYICSTCV
jgi:hypothetical protein